MSALQYRSTGGATWPSRLVVATSRIPPGEPALGIAPRIALRGTQSETGWRLARRALTELERDRREGAEDTTSPDAVTGISHSGRWAVAFAARGIQRVGIDIEVTRPRSFERLAAFMGWTPLLGAGERPDAAGAFTQLWTLWEAAVKCDAVPLLASESPAFTALSQEWRCGMESSWHADGYHALTRQIARGAWLTVVARCAPERVPIFELAELSV